MLIKDNNSNHANLLIDSTFRVVMKLYENH